MDLGLEGKHALVTGGSRGIGYGVAQVLAAEGCNLHLASRSAESLNAARKRLQAACKVDVTTHACDLSDSANVVNDENRWRELTAVFPLGRLGSVDEVANTVVFLASDRSSYTSSAIVTIDGGFSQRAAQIKEW